VKAVRFVRRTARRESARCSTASFAMPASRPQGFVPTPMPGARSPRPRGRSTPWRRHALHPVVPDKILAIGVNYRSHADESELDVPTVRSSSPSGRRPSSGPRTRSSSPLEEVGRTSRARSRSCSARRFIARTRRRHGVLWRRHRDQRRVRPARAARDSAAAVHARKELRHVLAARAVHRPRPTGSTRTTSHLTTTVSGEVMQDASTSDPRVRFRRSRRLPVEGPDSPGRGRHRVRDSWGSRRFAHASALSPRGATSSRSRSRASEPCATVCREERPQSSGG
jgi:hypothetical protein